MPSLKHRVLRPVSSRNLFSRFTRSGRLTKLTFFSRLGGTSASNLFRNRTQQCETLSWALRLSRLCKLLCYRCLVRRSFVELLDRFDAYWGSFCHLLRRFSSRACCFSLATLKTFQWVGENLVKLCVGYSCRFHYRICGHNNNDYTLINNSN